MKEEPDDSLELNPSIRTLKYGKRKLRSLTIYPLSIGDQFKVTNMVTEIVQGLVESVGSVVNNDYAFMTMAVKAIEKNLEKILALIADIPEEESRQVIEDLTNIQFVDLVESVWLVDYEPSLKKGRTLYERGKSVFSSEGSLPGSSKATPNTDLMTSSEKVTD